MKSIFKTGLAVLLITFAAMASGVMADSVNAATAGLTISPASLDIEVAPGDQYKGTLHILNESDAPMPYKAYVTPYSVTGEEYKPYFTPVKNAIDATKWVALGKQSGNMSVGGKEDVPYTITVPRETPGGSYFMTLFAETADKAEGKTGVVTHNRVGLVVYLRVSGDAKAAGVIASWEMPWLQEGPLRGMLKMENTGTVHYKTDIKAEVRDIFGNKKYDYVRQAQILPQKRRAIPVEWEKGAAFGLFKVSGEVTYLGNTEKLPEKTVLVMNTPTRIGVGAALLLIVVAFIVMRRKRAAESYKK